MKNKATHQLYRPNLISNARELRKNSTLSEVLLWEQIKGRQLLGYKFRRQVPIGKYIVDFYCRELQLALEIDGLSHDYKMEYDKQRQAYLQNQGITVLRISDIDVKKDIQIVVQRIVDVIETPQPTPTPPKRGVEPPSHIIAHNS